MSRTYIATFVSILVTLFATFNVELPYTNEQITEAIYIIVGVIAGLKILYERHKRGDVSFLGFKI